MRTVRDHSRRKLSVCAQKFSCGGDPLKLLQDCEGVPFGLREDYM